MNTKYIVKTVKIIQDDSGLSFELALKVLELEQKIKQIYFGIFR